MPPHDAFIRAQEAEDRAGRAAVEQQEYVVTLTQQLRAMRQLMEDHTARRNAAIRERKRIEDEMRQAAADQIRKIRQEQDSGIARVRRITASALRNLKKEFDDRRRSIGVSG